MQDQTDPSMEQALAAIKRVMAEDKDHRVAAAKASAAAPPPTPEMGEAPVLELDQPLVEDLGLPMVDLDAPMIDIPFEEDSGEPLVSEITAETTRARLAELQQAASAPPPAPTDMNPFEQMVREMMRPMLKDWLDEHLPRVIEEQVKREIGRITGQRF
jgi:cell pole-organizing protein PopZ